METKRTLKFKEYKYYFVVYRGHDYFLFNIVNDCFYKYFLALFFSWHCRPLRIPYFIISTNQNSINFVSFELKKLCHILNGRVGPVYL